MKHVVSILVLVISLSLCAQQAKFTPPSGKTLFVIGQDLGSAGGFSIPNNDGYVDHIKEHTPAGVTTYTDFPYLGGLKTPINYGAGDVCGQCIVDNALYKNSIVSIGLYLVDQLDEINRGEHDEKIRQLGAWIKDSKRPVFLRIGYEFDGAWNHYDPEEYKQAFRRMVDMFREDSVNNVAAVWHSGTSPVDDAIEGKHENIADWYPGDEYVDWMGYSWFLSGEKQHELTDELISFAREHNKPVMVAESAPQGYDLTKQTKRYFDTMIDGEPGEGLEYKSGKKIWEEWFVPFFSYIDKNRDVIRMVAYIDCNWDAQAMWGAPYDQGYWGDTRVEVNRYVKKQWLEKLSEGHWLFASPQLFDRLNPPTGG